MGKLIDFAERRQEKIVQEYTRLWKLEGVEEALNYLCEEVDAEDMDAVVDEAKRRLLKEAK